MATIREYFKARLEQYKNEPLAASYAYRAAKSDLARGRPVVDWGTHTNPKGHGDVLRIRDKTGKKRTFVIAIHRDDTMGAPWKEHDGHGVVSEWESRDKLPSEVVIVSDRHSFKRFYDIAESIEIAKRDSWGLSPEEMGKLAAELEREPTKGQIAARAVNLDCERLRQWCNDVWHWVGIGLIELDPAEIEYPENVANDESRDMAASLWGIESDSPDYHETVAFELLSEAI